MKRQLTASILFLILMVSTLTACASGNNSNQQGFKQVTPVNSLPTVVQRAGTGRPSASSGLLPQSTGVVSPGEPNQSSVLISSLVNQRIAGDNGELGMVQGAVLDSQSGQLQYLAVDTIGPNPTRHVLVPWGAFQVVTLPKDLKDQSTAPAVYLKKGITDLSTVPEVDFAKLQDPKNLPANWAGDTQNYWSSKVPGLPVTGSKSAGQPVLFSRQQSDGPVVKDNQSQDLGTLSDIILDANGKAVFALLKPGAFGDLSGQFIPIPWNKLTWSADQSGPQLNAPADALKKAPRYDPKNVPAFASPGWDTEWNQYWQAVK